LEDTQQEQVRERVRKAFGDRISAWRALVGLSQAGVDEALGKKRGYIAQIETGRLKPPEREVCAALDEVLRRAPGEVWSLAAPARLEDFDAEVWAWHRAQVDQARGFNLTPVETALVETLREVQASEDDHAPSGASFSVATWLDEHLKFLQVAAGWLADRGPRRGPESDRQELVRHELHSLLYALYEVPLELPEPIRLHLLRTAAAANGGLSNSLRESEGLRLLEEERRRDRARHVRAPLREEGHAEALPPEPGDASDGVA
jgi:transcriptional regulator with XRE-family HTH domain